MVEIIMTGVIVLIVALVMIGIGISQIRSKNPTGFYTGEKPPGADELTDVSGWNKKHGMMWLLYGVAMILGFIVAALIGNEIVFGIICGVIILGGIPVMMLCHGHWKKVYYK